MSVTSVINDWQAALIELLADEDTGLGFLFVAGERDGLSRDKDIGCVFSDGWSEASKTVSLANPRMTVRAWKRFWAEPAQDKPADPSTMYDFAAQLCAILEPVQASLLVGRLYFRITNIRIDHADQGIEAQLLGTVLNPATLNVPA